MEDHSIKVGFGLFTSQIVSPDFTPSVWGQSQPRNLQEQSGRKHRRGLRWTSGWQNNWMEFHDPLVATQVLWNQKGPTSILHHLVSEQHHFVLLLLCCVQCLHLSPSTARFEQLSNGDTRRPKSFCMFPPVTHKLCNLGVWILFMFGTFFFLHGAFASQFWGNPTRPSAHGERFIPLPSCQKLLGAHPKLLPQFFKPPFSSRRFTGQFGGTAFLRWCSFAGGVFHDMPIKHLTLVTWPLLAPFSTLVGFVFHATFYMQEGLSARKMSFK